MITPSRRTSLTSAALVALLPLALAHCGDDGGATGWIPREGTVTGVITTTTGSLAPPRAAALSPRSSSDVASPALARPTTPALLRAVIPRGVRIARADRPGATRGDLIVRFRSTALGAPPIGSAALGTAGGARTFGAAMRSRLAAMVPRGAAVAGVSPTILTARIHVADTTQRDAIAAALTRDPAVASVSRNRLIWLDEPRAIPLRTPGAAAGVPRTTPRDTLYPVQAWHYGLIDLPRAWSITTGSASVLVAVVDDGTRFDHPDIAANLSDDGFDFVSETDSLSLCAGGKISNADDADAYDRDPTIPASYVDTTETCFDPEDFGGHGLHVAGTIGAVGDELLGVTGVNWRVRILPIRALGVGGFGTTYDIAQGVLYAAGLPVDSGGGHMVQAKAAARIINLSLGGPDDDPTLRDAIVMATNAGALVVAAAGNKGSSAPFYPAAYPEVLAVAAVGSDGAPAPYSNFGSYVGIRAPGGNFALGDVTDMVLSTMWAFDTGSPDYAFAEGTSMAAPHVAGVAALVLAQSPALTAAELRSRLTSFAVGPATLYGAGLVNAYNSLTQSHGPPTEVHARLYSATTGAVVQTVRAQAGGAFAFTDVPDGAYYVYGGTDEAGDEQLGIPGRLWGAFGGSTLPTSLKVLGAGPYAASFSIGLPIQTTANHSIPATNVLVVGGYEQSTMVDASAIDFYRVTIPQAGTYTFETSGWVGACGFAREQATAIGVFDAARHLLASDEDFIDAPHLNFCSRLTVSLSRATYYVGVAGAFDGGRYRLQARAGS